MDEGNLCVPTSGVSEITCNSSKEGCRNGVIASESRGLSIVSKGHNNCIAASNDLTFQNTPGYSRTAKSHND
jgi:hypothetical protein